MEEIQEMDEGQEMTNKNETCANCGHDKRFHDGSTVFCKFIDKTENWDISEKAKRRYLELGINKLACCPCKKFVAQKDKTDKPLSEKIEILNLRVAGKDMSFKILHLPEVREAVKKLKAVFDIEESGTMSAFDIQRKIDEIFGEDLI